MARLDSTRAVRLGAALLILALGAVVFWNTRAPERPADLREARIPVAGLH